MHTTSRQQKRRVGVTPFLELVGAAEQQGNLCFNILLRLVLSPNAEGARKVQVLVGVEEPPHYLCSAGSVLLDGRVCVPTRVQYQTMARQLS